MTDPIVIVGSGLAGYTLAREFRKLEPTAPLLIVSRDDAGSYAKPMLSNALASGKTAATLVMQTAEQMAATLKAEIRPRTEVLAIDTAARRLTLRDGVGQTHEQAYGSLALALGADPIRAPLQGDAADQVLSVNDLDDFARFSAAIASARNVLIVGAGLIGCEFANDLATRGIQATVVDPSTHPLGRLLPPVAGDFFRARLAGAGIDFRMGRTLARLDRGADGRLQATLDNGQTVTIDAVLSAIGLRPRTVMAQAAGLTVNRGIVTDLQLQTSAPGVYALGDAVEVQGESGPSQVLPFVMPLMAQARALAQTLAGRPTRLSYPAMPVTVKSPACPTVVCPPPAGVTGQWRLDPGALTEPADAPLACGAHFVDEQGQLRGFALLGAATAQKQALAKQIPPWLG